jgi:hypothetical protein
MRMQRSHRMLPTLDFLKGFEAAARHLGFTKAASELFVTQSAVSRQIQSLEEQLGVVLFERRPKDLVLTQAGETLYRTASEVRGRRRRYGIYLAPFRAPAKTPGDRARPRAAISAASSLGVM